ncbi:SRPBCC family protein [Shewanella sp. WXL01]|uniref:SRPBCC family protein n=1 Tax=Shewanella maritima TaxID=2520507 RepID=A0A411PJ43_9GAMM|nr:MULTISPECIES: SRPBCC family protein [Shewanella]NKF51288.1 SRPBCC family protein [Shewanella sp. WXL01]QBF83597.1 SRPBCC family protein [Shewanella maritima]
MKITSKVTINKSATEMWKLIAHDFDKAYLWMAPIPFSKAIAPGGSKLGAPMVGRMCDLTEKPNGPQVKEVITHYSESARTLSFDVLPINNPAIIPIKQNHVAMSVREISPTQCEVSWTASPQLKWFAYPMYPLLRLMFPKVFAKLLRGLKDYAENIEHQPRQMSAVV